MILGIYDEIFNLDACSFESLLEPFRSVEQNCLRLVDSIVDMSLILYSLDPIKRFSKNNGNVDPYSSMCL